MRRTSSIAKRWTLKLSLALLAGAVATWAVAWGSALWGPDSFTAGPEVRLADLGRAMTDGWNPGASATEFGTAIATITPFYEMSRDLQRGSLFRTADVNVGFGGVRQLTFYDYGFPARALFARLQRDPATQAEVSTIRAAPQVLRPSANCIGLPTEVLPLGFALDTLLYGGVVLGVVEGVGFARRRRRIAKGRCPWCGYDRRGLADNSAACPECGRGA